jgi:hypothetical protein
MAMLGHGEDDMLTPEHREEPKENEIHKSRMSFTTRSRVCHDCGAKPGQLHELWCDTEDCPWCGKQLLACECPYKKLGIDYSDNSYTAKHGLTEKQMHEFYDILIKKGRIPYWPSETTCAVCGKLRPHEFSVNNKDWAKYVPPEFQGEVLCTDCYQQMREKMPNGWKDLPPSMDDMYHYVKPYNKPKPQLLKTYIKKYKKRSINTGLKYQI